MTRERRALKLGIPVDQLPDNRGKSTKNKKRFRDHYRWNNGRILSSHGYVKVRVGVGHALADPNGYAYEHLFVWIEAGRRLPEKGEVIHHRNEDKTDNQLSNLELTTRREYAAKHNNLVADAVVREIRERYASGEDATALADEFGFSFQRAYRFIRGETRREAGGPIQQRSLRLNANRNRVKKC